jgi:hypothetical protein
MIFFGAMKSMLWPLLFFYSGGGKPQSANFIVD